VPKSNLTPKTVAPHFFLQVVEIQHLGPFIEAVSKVIWVHPFR
jgi:hypothetical protein